MYCIVLLGMPASGKSTIANRYCERYLTAIVSSGDIARSMALTDSNVKNTLDAGNLAPEDAMRYQIRANIDAMIYADLPFILDGFPRFIEQDTWLRDNFGDDMKIIYVAMTTPIDECMDRANVRNRSDDNYGAFMNRVIYYTEHTVPVIIANSDNIIVLNGDIDDMVLKLHEEVIKRVNDSEV